MYTKVDKIIKTNEQLNRYGIINSNISNIKCLKSRLNENEYVVAVMGAMKSGKSTLMNSLMGYDLMPNENAACTLTTTDIVHGESDNKIKKVFVNKKTEYIEGENIHKLFHEDVRKSRSQNSTEDFFYEVKYPIYAFSDINSNIKFKLVDTPGYNEMEGLGVKKDKITKNFEEVLQRASFIIYVLDYQYYKSDENVEILQKIKDMRSDILENDRIIFVLNKVDLVGYKDGEVKSVIDKVSKTLQAWGVSCKRIHPLIAKQALLGRMVETNQDLSEVAVDLDNYIPIVEKEIGGKILKVKENINDIYKELIESSCIEKFEQEVIRPIFNNAENDIKKSAQDIIKATVKEMHEKIEDKKAKLVEKQKVEDKSIIQLKEKVEQVNVCLNESKRTQKEINNILRIPSFESVKKEEFYGFFINSSASYPDDYSYKYSSSSQAERAGKEAFIRWRNGIKVCFEDMYSYYSRRLQYNASEENYYYKVNTAISKKLKNLSEVLDKKLKQINSTEMISVISNINIMPDTLKPMTYENTKEYIEDFYDNSEFVDYDDIEEYVGESLFGRSKYKTKYCYDTNKARREQEKDYEKGANQSSTVFFNDYYQKKYNKYLKSVKDLADNEVAKVNPILNKIKKRLQSELDKLIENKKTNYDNRLIEIGNIEKELIAAREE